MGIVAVFGAAGFVGASLVEHLLVAGEHEVRPFIHSTGNAWRLSRRGLALESVDVRDRARVREALAGATHVVNCTYGPRDVMLAGLDNLLRESRAARVERYVHLSSVSAWGMQPPGTTLRESDSPRRHQLSGYGLMKYDQDRRVAAACRRGLPAVTLAPPMISGPHSPFLIRLLVALRAGTLALVDGGELPCSLCDVRNLVRAMELALTCPRAEGTPWLVTDGETPSWSQLTQRLAAMAKYPRELATLSRDEALRLAERPAPKASPVGALRTLASALATTQSRALLREDPLIRGMFVRVAARLPGLVRRLRARAARTGSPAAIAPYDPFALEVQTRAVRHQMDGALSELGYAPEVSFDDSMTYFARWYAATHGSDSDDWPLLARLWSPVR